MKRVHPSGHEDSLSSPRKVLPGRVPLPGPTPGEDPCLVPCAMRAQGPWGGSLRSESIRSLHPGASGALAARPPCPSSSESDAFPPGDAYYLAVGGAVAQHNWSHITTVLQDRGFQCQLIDRSEDLGMISVQGPARYGEGRGPGTWMHLGPGPVRPGGSMVGRSRSLSGSAKPRNAMRDEAFPALSCRESASEDSGSRRGPCGGQPRNCVRLVDEGRAGRGSACCLG